MRIADLARGLNAALILAALAALPASAFEIEEERRFGPATATETVVVLSTTDADIVTPLIEGFLRQRPGLALHYVVASSQEVYRAVADENAAYDLVISSAMDLQLKLANDGHAQAFQSAAVGALPGWARWRDRLFGFALEPVVVLVSRRAFEGLPLPQTRRDLVAVLRENPDRFRGRVATYDPRTSGAGYLFAMQDARQSEAFWRLAEVMGRLDARLYCCSVDMIEDLAAGRIAVAYNVVGSYAAAHARSLPDAAVIEPQDFTVALLRTALIPPAAPRPDLGGALLDFLVSPEGQALSRGDTGFPPLDQGAIQLSAHIRPIRLDPGLLVNLDAMTRRNFLREWDAAMTQP
ncbi:MAG TPA: ABC transporter substrate-binding protein [Paracoccaceae bacterium]|nr:ABC transporter substrate-binding protein [Paracoccaceae bacterium]HMO71390.1 ABC transporter substrate-binding protein [Paracoccaceae bacterium]